VAWIDQLPSATATCGYHEHLAVAGLLVPAAITEHES
jgi:hypothetical protein